MRRVTVSEEVSGMTEASKPMSSISCMGYQYIDVISLATTYTGEFFGVPDGGIVLNHASLSEKRNLDRMNSVLRSKHALNRLYMP